MTKRALWFFLPTLALVAPAVAKPPVAPRNLPASVQPAAGPVPDRVPAAGPGPWLRWMLEQDGGASAVAVTWPEMLQAASGHQVVPFEAADPADAATATKIGSVLDALLPRLNRPDGPVRSARRLALVPSLVEDELQTALSAMAGLLCEPALGSTAGSLGDRGAGTYPALKLTDQTSHRTYYLGVAFYPTGQRESASPLLQIDPASAASSMATGGTCLLVCLEHNNKSGGDLAFLNWELIDLAAGKVRVRTSFQARTNELLLPAATIGDGRRGRD